jgi:hypothetical protein
MESKCPAASDPLYSDNYKTDDWAWGVSLGEGKKIKRIFESNNNLYRCFR